MVTSKDDPIPATSRDSCPGTNLASTFMSGYHPDMTTKTLTSTSGNGANNGAAIYILSEIGQEKQLDVNHEAFMGYEEPIPLTGSASLALVRLNVQGECSAFSSLLSDHTGAKMRAHQQNLEQGPPKKLAIVEAQRF